MARNPAVLVSLLADWDNKKLLQAQKQIGQMAGVAADADRGFATSFRNIGKSAIALGAAFGVGFQGIQALGNVLRDSVAEANEAIKVNAATAQIIKSTGGAAQVTADQVANLSEKISNQIAVDDELIQQSANLILTFKNIRNVGEGVAAIFDRTVMAAQDLAAAGFGDAESAAKMLGKALNDPIRGMTALSRAGVTFSEQQKDQIRTLMEGGDVLRAQQLILQEVESQVGGVAAATTTATARFSVMFDNLKEDIGLALMPLIEALVNMLTPAFKNLSTTVRDFSQFVRDNAEALKFAAVAVGTFTAALLLKRTALFINIATMGVYQTVVLGLVRAIDLASAAVTRLAASTRLLVFAAAIAGVTALIYYLEQAATAQERFRDETEGTRRSIDKLRDSTGQYTAEARYLLATNRFSHMAQERLSTAISGTVSAAIEYGNTLPTVRDLTQEIGEESEIAAQSVMQLLMAAVESRRLLSDMQTTSGTVTSAITQGLEQGADLTAAALKRIREENEKTRSGAKKAKEEIDKLTESEQKRFDSVRQRATEALQASRDTMESFKSTIAGYLNIGNAAEAYAARQKAVTDTLTELENYRRDLTEEATEEQIRTLGELQAAHNKARDAARTGAQGIVEEFVSQADRFKEFGAKLLDLMRRGLNKTTLKQIMDLGYERGTEVVDAYFRGQTQELIDSTNKAVEDYNNVANEIAREAALTFEAAGIRSAIAMARGFMLTLAKGSKARKEMRALIDELQAELEMVVSGRFNTPSARPSGGGGGGGGGGTSDAGRIETVQTASGPVTFYDTSGLNNAQTPAGAIPTGTGHGSWWNPISNQLEYFAKGGLVTGPTLGMLGEAGPEVVIPLDRLGSMGGRTINVTINAGMGTDGAEVGRQVVDVLKQYERRNGAIPITVRS